MGNSRTEAPAYGTFDMDVVANGEPCDCGALDTDACRCPTVTALPDSEASS